MGTVRPASSRSWSETECNVTTRLVGLDMLPTTSLLDTTSLFSSGIFIRQDICWLSVVNAVKGVDGGDAGDSDVLLGGRQVAPAQQRLQRNRRDTFVGVVVCSGRPQTVRINPSLQVRLIDPFLDSSIDGGA